jgi:hypothetical protein
MGSPSTQPRTRLQRHPERAVPEEAAAILAAGRVAHVGFVQDDQPFVIPMAYHYDPVAPRALYLHGALPGRLLRLVASGAPVTIAVTLLDGLVFSRTALYHSVNYRSVVCFAHAVPSPDGHQAGAVLEAMIARYFPGRTAGRDYAVTPPQDIAATNLVALEIDEWSAKARRGGPKGPRDNEADAPGTAGVVQLRTISFDIGRAELSDAQAIAWLLKAAFAEYESRYTPAALAATTPPSEEIEQRIREGPVWVAWRDGTCIGTVSAVARDRKLYIRGMGVIPTARGLGVGAALLEHVESYARASGLLQLELRTTPFLTAAILLYERAGFCRTDSGPTDHFGTATFTMTKPLEA